MLPERTRLPVRIVVRVRDDGVPEGDAVLQRTAAVVGQRAHLQMPRIPVGGVGIGTCRILRRRPLARLIESLQEVVGLRQLEESVHVTIVTQPPIDHRRRRIRKLERGMRVDHARRHEEPGRRIAPHAHAAIVMADILEDPLDGVVRIGGFVDGSCLAVGTEIRRHERVVSFAHVAAAHVLVHEDPAFAVDVGKRTELCRICICAVRGHAVRRAHQQNGNRLAGVARHVDGRERLVPSRMGILTSRFEYCARTRATAAGSGPGRCACISLAASAVTTSRHEERRCRRRPAMGVPMEGDSHDENAAAFITDYMLHRTVRIHPTATMHCGAHCTAALQDTSAYLRAHPDNRSTHRLVCTAQTVRVSAPSDADCRLHWSVPMP